MKSKYSDSLLPFGIGSSFFLIFFIFMITGAAAGFLLREREPFANSGGIILLIIVVLLVLMPVLYNRVKSSFEQTRIVLAKCDGIGVIQGLRNAMFRLIIYEEGIEIRAFFHRYYIPFNEMKSVRIEKGFTTRRLKIKSGINGLPDYIVSSGKEFCKLAELIEKKSGEKQTSVNANQSGVQKLNGFL